jgi:DNA polymerase III alpha subunit
MGFYAPAQIVRDARDHGVEVRPVRINDSLWPLIRPPQGARFNPFAIVHSDLDIALRLGN